MKMYNVKYKLKISDNYNIKIYPKTALILKH